MKKHDGKATISIVTVSFNSGKTIRDTLESLASQDARDVEVIVVDGGSSDNTLKIVSTFEGTVTKVISEKDRGIYDAMNKGIMASTGEIIGLLNSDDYYVHDHVLSQVQLAFDADPDLDMLMGAVDYVKPEALTVSPRRYSPRFFRPWMLLFGIMPPHPAIFVRRRVYDRIGLYKIHYRIAADFDFVIRCLLIAKTVFRINPVTWVHMRIGGVSSRGWRSYVISTNEMYSALSENNFFSLKILLWLRLPIKYISQVLSR